MSPPRVRREDPWTASAKRVARALATAAVLSALFVPASESRADLSELGVSGNLSIEEGYTDNVRWDKNGLREGAWYTTFETRVDWQHDPREWNRWLRWLPHRLGALTRYRVYSGFGNRDYAEFGPTVGYDWDRASLTLEYRYSPDHLRVDPATTIDAFADVQNFSAELRSKFGKRKRWTALLVFDLDAEDYDPGYKDRDFVEETVEAGLRCRATPLITPRASVTYAHRDANSSNYDREEVGLLFGFDLYLPAGVRALFRYEKTWRNFLVGYPGDSTGDRNNNYGREDDAYNFDTGLEFPMPWLEAIQVHLRYRHRDNDSSRPDRNYKVNEGSLKLAYGF